MKIPFHPTKTKRASFFAHREYLFLHFSTNQITVTHRKRSLLLLLLYHHYHSHSLSLPRVYRHSILSSLPPKCCCCLRNFHNRSSGAHTFTDVQCTSISLLDLLLFSPVTLAFPRISFPFTFFIPLNWFNVLKQPVFFWHNFFPSNSPKFDRTTQKHSVAGSFSLKCTIVIAN